MNHCPLLAIFCLIKCEIFFIFTAVAAVMTNVANVYPTQTSHVHIEVNEKTIARRNSRGNRRVPEIIEQFIY